MVEARAATHHPVDIVREPGQDESLAGARARHSRRRVIRPRAGADYRAVTYPTRWFHWPAARRSGGRHMAGPVERHRTDRARAGEVTGSDFGTDGDSFGRHLDEPRRSGDAIRTGAGK